MGASLSSAATAAAPADVVQRHVNDNAVAVFSKTYCVRRAPARARPRPPAPARALAPTRERSRTRTRALGS